MADTVVRAGPTLPCVFDLARGGLVAPLREAAPIVIDAVSTETHTRLLGLKARYDPANLFRFAGLTR